MALRSGYKGFKKLAEGLKMIRPGTLAVDNVALSSTFFPRDEQIVLGAKNMCPVPDKTEVSRSVTYVMVNNTGIVTANGTVDEGKTSYGNIYTRSDSPLILPPNRYKMKCDFTAQTGVSVSFLCTRNGESHTYGTVNSSNDIIEAEVLEGDTIGVGIVCQSGTVLDNKTFAPMIWLASDPNDTFVPSAMTNRELTLSAADQKATINAIITAATGAADFAAFKAAMEAITPVTRSLSRTASPEDVPEEVIEEKTVTKKTTKKTVKEGE